MDTGESVRRVEATVVELLPNGAVSVELESKALVKAHPASGTKTNFMRLRVRDRVLVELSPNDERRGRIVKLI